MYIYKKKIKIILVKIIRNYLNIVTTIFSNFKLQERIVIFSNNGNTWDCNPKLISDELHKNKKIKIICIINKDLKIQENKDFLYIRNKNKKIMGLKSLYYINTSKIIITNSRLKYPEYLNKRINQYYIQTWHSSIRLKKIEGDAKKYLSDTYIESAKKDSIKTDFILSGNQFTTEIIKRAFFFNNEILEIGNPRVDYLIRNKKNKENFKKELLQIKNKKILVYCPTFRNVDEEIILKHNFEEWLIKLENLRSEEWMILIKYHPNTKIKYKSTNDKIKIIGNNILAQDLVILADLLVTDFSSIMFDAIFTETRCILYSKDFDQYIESERELYFNYNELPFRKYNDYSFLEDQKSLEDNFIEEYKIFLKKIGNFEKGNSLRSIRNKIDKLLKN